MITDLNERLLEGLPQPEWFQAPPDGWNPLQDHRAPLVWVGFTGPDKGRFAAVVAPFDACILDGDEKSGCFKTPRSVDGYRYAHIGSTALTDGTTIATANIGGDINHALTHQTVDRVLDKYANTATRVANVHYYENEEMGAILALGCVARGVTAGDALVAMQSAISGDWRYISELKGHRFIGSQLVNVPGFRPWQRGMALTAAVMRPTRTAVASADCGCPETSTITWVPRTGFRARADQSTPGRVPRQGGHVVTQNGTVIGHEL
jgi:hypothetical protein